MTDLQKMPDRRREPLTCKDNNIILDAEKDEKKKKYQTMGFKQEKSGIGNVHVCSADNVASVGQRGICPVAVGSRSRLLFAHSLLLEQDLKKGMANMDMHVEKYACEIFSNMMKEQAACCFKTYDVPRRVTAPMRAILVDWLVQVHEYCTMQEETLYLAIYLMNLFLKTSNTRIPKLQLVGATCLFLACKMEENAYPEPTVLCFMMENTYDNAALLKMERQILSHLKFDLRYTQPLDFLRLLIMTGKFSTEVAVKSILQSKTNPSSARPIESVPSLISGAVASENDSTFVPIEQDEQKVAEVYYLAMYFMELMLMESEAMTFEPAQLAEAGLSLAQKVLQETKEECFETCNETHKLYTYGDTELLHVEQLMAHAALRASTSETKATYLKYSKPSRSSVSSGSAIVGTQYLSSLVNCTPFS
ncbi:cyclin-P isoform X2 [Lissotriton helveticus]